MATKLCGQCHMTFDSSHFHKRAASKDGLAACCKKCQRNYDRARLHKPDRVFLRYDYKRTKSGKERIYSGWKAWIARHPAKRSAHIIVGNALRDGKLRKAPCEVCGHLTVEAHHDDYSKPLEVRWLCKIHHDEHHMRERDIAAQEAYPP